MSAPNRHSVSVAAVVTDDLDRVLVVQRRDNGRWEIPGGVLELAESIPTGLRREVLEETGLAVDPLALSGVYKNMRLGVVALVFRATVVGGVAGPTEESAQVAWWSLHEVQQKMAEVFAIRVADAVSGPREAPAIRMHDGTALLNEPPTG